MGPLTYDWQRSFLPQGLGISPDCRGLGRKGQGRDSVFYQQAETIVAIWIVDSEAYPLVI